ncbi:MAG: tripartite tricarboxylate transporter permease [Erysipelotrichaceae bacterium]|nr:tripartite tricarboxylate transporter permease [Erysipelotrichaceae bacterium]
MSALGSLWGFVYALPLFAAFSLILPLFQTEIDWVVGLVLLAAAGLLIVYAKTPFWALLLFAVSGFLGIFSMRFSYFAAGIFGTGEVLLPLLTGLFGIPVLLHNETINAVARNMDGSLINGQVHVSGLTFEELMNYDFGIICGEAYRGLRVTTLEEFLAFCKAYGIHPYLEMKGETVDTQDEVDFLLAMVDSYGMRGNVTWISFSSDPLRYVINRDPEARIGYLIAARSDLNYIVSSVSSLRAQGYDAFIDAVFTASEALAPLCQNAGVPLEVWTVNSEAYIRTLNPYISGITTDVLHVEY